MRESAVSKQRANIFVSAKTIREVPVAHELVRHALIQATLDPAVRAIEFLPTVTAFGHVIALDAIVLRGDAGDQILDVAETRPIRTLDDEGLALLAVDQLGLQKKTLSAVEIGSQPTAANSSLVWNCRYSRVQATDRVRVLQVLSEDGPIIPLARLSAEVRRSNDPVAAVLAMASSISSNSISHR